MSDSAVLSALRRMGYPGDEMSGHGFRAMARTMFAERLDVAESVIGTQLAHSVPDALGRAYHRTEFIAQRRQICRRGLTTLMPCGETVRAPEISMRLVGQRMRPIDCDEGSCNASSREGPLQRCVSADRSALVVGEASRCRHEGHEGFLEHIHEHQARLLP